MLICTCITFSKNDSGHLKHDCEAYWDECHDKKQQKKVYVITTHVTILFRVKCFEKNAL